MIQKKVLTEEDVDLLISENWLTGKQQSEFHIYEGVIKTLEEIKGFCPDQVVLNFIFKETEIQPIDIKYNLVSYYHGESTSSESFNFIEDAIFARERLIKSRHPLDFRIEVSYSLKGNN